LISDVDDICWCPWSTGAAFCRNQSAGGASS